ncbi:MAG: GTP 3',8-cyclase MoaA [Myxococcota bacterium]
MPSTVSSTDPSPVVDRWQRPLRTLRLSVTDRCNLRCQYCMPEETYVWLPRPELLDFGELTRLARLFCELGVARIRLTGGEPLLRRDLPVLVAMLRANTPVREVSLTTNGVLLARFAADLRAAGLDRVTVSVDTLRRDRFAALSRRDQLDAVRDGVAAAVAAGFGPSLKLDTVVMRGVNEDKLSSMLSYAAEVGAELRFIEYMDVAGATRWRDERVVSRSEMLRRIADTHGPARALPGRGSAPAERFALANGQVFGIIASTTQPFCGACDRSRLTADGLWLRCLYASSGTDLKTPLRSGASDDVLRSRLRAGWRDRDDRGAERRQITAAVPRDQSLVPVDRLRREPHLEMHTRGG